VNLPCPLQGLAHSGAVEVGRPRHVEDRFFAARDEIDRIGQSPDGVCGDDHGAVEVGVNEVAIADAHAEDIDLATHLNKMHMRMARHDAAADDLKAGRQHIEVAERSVCDATLGAEREMNRRLHLAPEGAEAGTIVDILDDGDCRQVVGGDVIVPFLARRNAPSGRSLDRIVPVRATPAMGASLRSAATIGATVKPNARRSGAMTSRPLQMVGVSQRRRTSRSAAEKGREGMGGLSG
jgi:hypothetical protein